MCEECRTVDLLMCLSCHWLQTASSTGIAITSYLPWKSLNWLQGGQHCTERHCISAWVLTSVASAFQWRCYGARGNGGADLVSFPNKHKSSQKAVVESDQSWSTRWWSLASWKTGASWILIQCRNFLLITKDHLSVKFQTSAIKSNQSSWKYW